MNEQTVHWSSLYQSLLITPLVNGFNSLKIISGYASATMLSRFLVDVTASNNLLSQIELIVGMTGREGIPTLTHQNLLEIVQQHRDKIKVSVRYLPEGTSVHSKVLVWEKPTGAKAFLGSANFTQNGFGIGYAGTIHHEIMASFDVEKANEYYSKIFDVSVAIDSPNIKNLVKFVDLLPEYSDPDVSLDDQATEINLSNYPYKVLPLVQLTGKNRGKVHNLGGGLNWGQRTGRAGKDEAYIPVPAHVTRSGFLPPKGVHFDVLTDDSKTLIFTLAQGDIGKALHTPLDNAEMGRYFKERLGVRFGAPVLTEDLEHYGSKTVRLYRINPEQYYLSFKPNTTDLTLLL